MNQEQGKPGPVLSTLEGGEKVAIEQGQSVLILGPDSVRILVERVGEEGNSPANATGLFIMALQARIVQDGDFVDSMVEWYLHEHPEVRLGALELLQQAEEDQP